MFLQYYDHTGNGWLKKILIKRWQDGVRREKLLLQGEVVEGKGGLNDSTHWAIYNGTSENFLEIYWYYKE